MQNNLKTFLRQIIEEEKQNQNFPPQMYMYHTPLESARCVDYKNITLVALRPKDHDFQILTNPGQRLVCFEKLQEACAAAAIYFG